MPTLQLVIDARRAKAGADAYNRAAKSTVASSRAAGAGVDRVNRKMTNLQTTGMMLKRMLGGLFVGFTLFTVVRSLVTVNAEFEQTIAILQGVSGIADKTDARFVALIDTARELGATTRFSAKEAAEGLLFLARAGFSVEEQIAAIPSVLNLATTSGMELGRAADFASNILQGFRMEAGQMIDVVDTLTIVANRSNTSVQQLAEAMKFAAPVAGALGISVQETAAAIGVLGDSGIQASLAGTNLRGITAALLDPTDKITGALGRLGLQMSDVTPMTKNYAEIFGTLADANFTAVEAVQIFGRRNAAAALVLAASADKIERLTEATAEYAGETERIAALMEDTIIGQWKAWISAMQEAILVTGDSGLTGGLKNLLRFLTSVTRIIAGSETEMERATSTAKMLAAAIQGIAVGVAVFVALKVAISAVTLATKLFTGALAANPIGLIAVGITLAVTALIYFKDELLTLRGTTASVMDWVQAAFSVIWSDITEVAGAIGPLVTETFNKVWGWLADSFNAAKDFVFGIFNSVGSGWGDAFSQAFGIAKTIANKVIGVIAGVQAMVNVVIANIIEALMQLGDLDFSNGFSGFIESARKASVAMVDAMDFDGMADEMGEAFLKQFNADHIENLVGAVNSAFAAVGDGVGVGFEFADAFTKSYIDEFAKPYEEYADRIAVKAQELADARAELAAEVDADSGRAQELADEIAQLNKEIGEAAGGLEDITAAVDAAADAMERATEGAKDYTEMMAALTEKNFILTNGLSKNEIEMRKGTQAAREMLEAQRGLPQFADKSSETGVDEVAFQQFMDTRLQATRDLIAANQELALQDERANKAAKEATKAIQSNFEDVLFGAESATEAVENLGRALAKVAFRSAFDGAAGSLFTDLGASFAGLFTGGTAASTATAGGATAMGGVFQGGVKTFAQGGVLDGPTSFPMKGGMGLAGEAGPEAIMPLGRDEAGNLGVRGGVTVNMTVNTPNADSFRRSKQQITARLREGIG